MEEHGAKERGKPPENKFRKRLFIVVALVVLIGAVTVVTVLPMTEKPSFCASCHIIKPYYQGWVDGELLAAKHGDTNVKCLDCHTRTLPEKMQEGLNYVTGNYETPLKERDFSQQDCLKCHQDRQKMIAATNFAASNPHESHMGDIDCHLCHKMHRQSEVYCAQCHDFDWFKKLDNSWKVPTK